MALYEVYVPCDDCNDFHSTGIRFSLDDVPTEGVTAHLNILTSEEVRCPETGRILTQEDNDQIFLKPVR